MAFMKNPSLIGKKENQSFHSLQSEDFEKSSCSEVRSWILIKYKQIFF